MQFNTHPLLKVIIILGIVATAAYGISYATLRCWTYTVDHPTTVADKDHNIWYTSRCIAWDDDGYCLAYTQDRHEDWSFIMADGYRVGVGEGKYQATQIGQNYTYTTHHAACR